MHGYHLQLDGDPLSQEARRLTGSLADGTPLDVEVVAEDDASVQLYILVESEKSSIGRLKAGFSRGGR